MYTGKKYNYLEDFENKNPFFIKLCFTTYINKLGTKMFEVFYLDCEYNQIHMLYRANEDYYYSYDALPMSLDEYLKEKQEKLRYYGELYSETYLNVDGKRKK